MWGWKNSGIAQSSINHSDLWSILPVYVLLNWSLSLEWHFPSTRSFSSLLVSCLFAIFFLEKNHESNWFLHFTECHFFLYIIILIPLLPPKLFFIIFSYCFEISCSLEESAPSSTCMNIKMHSVVFKPPVKTTNSWKTWTSWLAWST